MKTQLSFSELWQVTGLSKAHVENWTNGRPFKITPSVMQASGKGSRNVYALEDAYLIVFLDLMRKSGLSTEALTKIVLWFNLRFKGQEVPALRYFAREHAWIVVNLSKYVLTIDNLPNDKHRKIRRPKPIELSDYHDQIAIQISVNLNKLRQEVDERVGKLR